NTSDLTEQRYSSNFTGEEFFLKDHRLRTQSGTEERVLPGVAYLEMARAAIEHASPQPQESSILELHNTVWAEPVVVPQNAQFSVRLLANDHDQISYEIYSTDTEQEIVHCQGHAVRSHADAPQRLDLEQLKGQMRQGQPQPSEIYSMCASG